MYHYLQIFNEIPIPRGVAILQATHQHVETADEHVVNYEQTECEVKERLIPSTKGHC